MKKFLFIIILAVFVAAQAGTKIEPIDKTIMHHVFNGEWQKADSILDMNIKLNPQSPKYYSLKAPFYFYSRYFVPANVSRDSLWLLVEEYSKKAIEIGEGIDDKTTEDKFYIGSAYGFLCRYQVRHEQLWNGYWSAWDCEDYLEEVIEEDPEFYDAYLGLGVMEYYPDVAVNGFMGALAWVVGMSGDREKGLEYFHTVSEKGELFNTEADFILGLMYRFQENDLLKAHGILSKLQEKFPNNNFIANQTNQTKFVQIFEEKGVDFLETEFDSLASKYNINNANVLNGMGYYFMGRERYDEALAIFQTNIKLFPDVANCYDSCAECYFNMGNEEMSIKYYKMAYKKFDSDETANEEFKQRVKDGIIQRLSTMGASVEG